MRHPCVLQGNKHAVNQNHLKQQFDFFLYCFSNVLMCRKKYAYWKHVTNIFFFEDDNPDPDCPRKNEKANSFGHLSSPLKKTRLGSIPLEKTVS